MAPLSGSSALGSNFLLPLSPSVMSDSFQTHRLQSTRFLCPCDFSGKNTEMGCHFLLQQIFPTQGSNSYLLHRRQILYPLSQRRRLEKWKWLVAQSTLCNPMDCSPPGSTVHGILTSNSLFGPSQENHHQPLQPHFSFLSAKLSKYTVLIQYTPVHAAPFNRDILFIKSVTCNTKLVWIF